MNDKTRQPDKQSASDPGTRLGRRDVLKALASIPAMALFVYELLKKRAFDGLRKLNILSELGAPMEAPAVVPPRASGELIRLGIIGYGGRGEHLTRGAGFAHSDWTERKAADAKKNRLDKAFETFMKQQDLNVVINGVCDLFDVRAERVMAASKNDLRPGAGTRTLTEARRYRHYTELLNSKDIDAVIVATPDHWHSRITIDALEAGKHVYCEKCMTRTIEEAFAVRKAVKRTGNVFQLGHQNRQVETYEQARRIVESGILGLVTLVEVTTNRNSPGGAWVWGIHPDGNPKTIDWQTFQQPSPNKVPFSLERFFRWRCWYDYGTGLSGDLFSHEFDAFNQIMNVGIPKYAVASGGIYRYKDGRDVPDVFQVTFEYPDKNLTLIYSSTLASGRNRGNLFMGHDATMQLGNEGSASSSPLSVTADHQSTRFRQKIDSGEISTSLPLFAYSPGSRQIDGITSASAKYFASKGLVYTYRGGKRVDPTHLHIKDWLDGIRHGTTPRCNIDVGFEEAIACHMATKAFLEGRRVEWDSVNEKVI